MLYQHCWIFYLLSALILNCFAYPLAIAEVLVDDPLTNGTTSGVQHGGAFTNEGWKTTDWYSHISYDLGPAISSGRISFDVKGLTTGQEIWNWEQDHMWHSVFGMWDGDFERYGIQAKFNPYKCQMWIARCEGDPYKSGHVTLRANFNALDGYDDDPNAYEVVSEGKWDWDPGTTYHFVLEWGHSEMRWLISDDEAIYIDYSSTGEQYAPPHHVMQLGFGTDNIPHYYYLVTPRYLIYSNFKVESFQDNEAPVVDDYQPQNGSQEIDPDTDIRIKFNEPMDKASVQTAFSISPMTTGAFAWSGTSVYFIPDEFLQENTTYTVSLANTASDLSGNALLSNLTFTFQTRSLNQSTVGIYKVFEVSLKANNNSNAYTNAWVKGTFNGPGKTITIDGFWDGGKIWKVRMAPTVTGTWHYTITSADPGMNRSGSFECVNSNSKGFLRKNPQYPYTFMYDDGTPFFWKGETSWRGFTSSIPYESRFIPYIDKRVSEGFNAVQSILVSYINGLGFWKNEGGLIFDESSGQKDYDQLNPDYFHWVDKRIEYMDSKGVVPVIFFTWAQELVNFTEEQFKRFERYVIARYAAYNVIWVISGEYDEAYTDNGWDQADIERYCTFAFDLDPYHHPITLHPTGRSSSREFGDREWLGCVMQQSPFWHHNVTRDREFEKPVVNGEYGYAGWNPDEDVLVGAWDIITAGGFFTAGFFTTFAPDKGGWDLNGNQEQADQLSALFQLVEATEWWKMKPHDDLVNTGHCLAQPGKEYIIYLQDGGTVTLDLKDATGALPVEWLNPRDGSYHSGNSVSGGNSVNLTTPFSGGAVVHVGEWLAKDDIPPNPPKNLVSTGITEHTITLKWDQPDPASDGDRANQFHVYRDDQFINSVVTTYYMDLNLAENTSYKYDVFSVDDRQNLSITSISGQFITLADTEPPYIARVWLVSPTELKIRYSEPVESKSAAAISNYRIEPPIAITNAVLAADGQNVTLTTMAHSVGQTYSLIVNNVKDQARNANVITHDTRIEYKINAELQITNLKPSNYRVEKLKSGDPYYIDRDYHIGAIPAGYENALWIMTANDDKAKTGDDFLTFDINLAADIYVAFDASATNIPGWLQPWQSTNNQITTTDDSYFVLYRKTFAAGPVRLGANYGDNSRSMYLVLVQTGRKSDITAPAPPANILLIAK